MSDFAPIRSRSTLTWRDRSHFSRNLDVFDGESRVATLEWPRFFSYGAVGSAQGGSWEFRQSGQFRHRIAVREAGMHTDLASIELRGWKFTGELHLGGRGYRLLKTSFWCHEWAVTDHTGERLIDLRAKRMAIKGCGEIDILRDLGRTEDLPLPLLILIGLYALRLQVQGSAHATS